MTFYSSIRECPQSSRIGFAPARMFLRAATNGKTRLPRAFEVATKLARANTMPTVKNDPNIHGS